MPHTALAILIREAEPRVGALRQAFDPGAALGVPAHVTVVVPFLPPEQVDADVARRLKLLFRRFSPFTCVLSRVDRFPATAFLAPAAPRPFVELTTAVAQAFPEYPPYGGAHASIVPHLTVADGDAAAADQAERELRADLERNGPVIAHCRAVTLLGNATGRWERLHEFPLVGHQG